MNKTPAFVAISDIHFNIYTLDIATKALRAAIWEANRLDVSLVIAGDLNDTKALIRGEVANTLILLLKFARNPVYILVGNHDKLHEKSLEHGLNYLSPYAIIIDKPMCLPLGYNKFSDIYAIPYISDPEELDKQLSLIKAEKTAKILIMHQGFKGAEMGHYVQDKSSTDPFALTQFKIFSGHYHKHQTIGPVTYIGNPYTLTFGEAEDGPKGILIVNEDGSFEHKPLGLRAHKVIKFDIKDLEYVDLLDGVNASEDIIWIQVLGPSLELAKINKKKLGEQLLGHANYKLELCPYDTEILTANLEQNSPNLILEQLIQNSAETEDDKKALKELAYEIIDG